MKKAFSFSLFMVLAVILALVVCFCALLLWPAHNPVDNGQLEHQVRTASGMGLQDLEDSLRLAPIAVREEPFFITYSIPLKLDASSWTYHPMDTVARTRVLALIDNGREAYAYDIERQTNGTYCVTWNTTFATYGVHALQVKLIFPWSGANTISGPIWTENVTNIVQVEPGTESFGTQMWFHLFLHVPSADYKINICDTNKSVLKEMAGHTENGVISEIWDLRINGQIRHDSEFYSEVSVTPTVTDTNGLIKSNAPTIHIFYH